MKKIFTIVLIWTISILGVKAEPVLAFFRHITVEDGLSSNQVRSLLQDSQGFVWLGTDQGLNRYDGHKFAFFPLPEQWRGATLLTLMEDGSHIWIGTDRGLFIFDRNTENIVRKELITENKISVSSQVNNICKDKDGNIWIATYGQGLFRYNVLTEDLKQFPFFSIDGKMSNVYVDGTNQVWALTNWADDVLFRLNKSIDEFESFPLYLSGKTIKKGGLALLEDKEKRLWLGSWNDGLYEIDRITGNIERYQVSSKNTGAELNHIHSMLEYEPGVLLIGSDEGLLLYDIESRRIEHYNEDNGSGKGLSSRFVYPLMKDREGSLWVGTYYGGVNYHSPYSAMFDSYKPEKGRADSPAGKIISNFCEDSNHNIWIASDDGGLLCYTPHNEKFRNYRNVPGKNSLSYDNVHALCLDGSDLWIGTYTGGVNVLDLKTGRFRHYISDDNDPNTLEGTSSYSIFKDKENNIWVSSMTGINLYDREKDNFIRIKKVMSPIMDTDQDADGNLWFSTQGDGLLMMDAKTKTWRNFCYSGEEGGLPSDYVNCAMLDSKGVMWFGTSSGLCYYDRSAESFVVLAMGDMFSNIRGIVEDQQVLWITTAHGLVRYNPNGETQVFSTNNGLLSNQFITNSIFKASDGRIYMGTTSGFNAFYPYNIHTNNTIPQMALLSLTLDNTPVTPDFSSSDGMGKLDLSHRDNALTLHFAALSYCVPNKNQYAYMLEGFDHDWIYVGNTSQATYTNLPAGTYVFKVKGTNSDGVWNEEPAKLRIVVHPHPLLAPVFKILYGVLLLLLMACILQFTIFMNNRKHKKEIVELEDRKEKEVYESKIKFFTMIAHEIRTPVSLIIGPLENIIKKASQLPEKVKDELQTIDRNSQRLLYLVNQLLDFRKVEQDAMVMRFVDQPVIPLLRSICERFELTITQNGSEFVVEYPKEDFNVCVDSEAMTKLVSNLLTNASKYTKNFVRLSCSLCEDENNMFVITVYDNGCGISKEEQSKIFLPFYQTLENKPGTGIGLSLVKSIVELHGGTISLESETGVYSSFSVRLPVTRAVEEIQIPEAEQQESSPANEVRTFEDILNTDIIELKPQYKPVILIVDDNEDIVRFLADTLSEQYEILSAYSGQEALDFLESHPDTALIISDWMMPGMDGTELCKAVRANMHTSHIPFILLTAKTDDPSKVVGMDCGADIFIEKPFSVQYLEACIRNQVTMRAMLRQRYSSLPLTPITDVASTSMDNRFLQNLTNLIEENLADSNLSVDFLTEQMGISRSSFYNKIKSLTNSTPNELIQLMRLKKAAQLLTEHKYRINEICYMVGFNNPSYFSKCFAKQFGMKPGEFAAKSAE